MIDLTNLPMMYDESIQEYVVTVVNNTDTPEIGINDLLSIMTLDTKIPEHFTCMLQKRRIESNRIRTYIRTLFFSSSYIFYMEEVLQMEHVRHPEKFLLFCVPIDDYYVHQSTVSEDIFKKYNELFLMIRTNIERQSKILSVLFRNEKSIEDRVANIFSSLDKYQRYSHITSSLYNRIRPRIHLQKVIERVIDCMFLVYKTQNQYILQSENDFYVLTFHSKMILDIFSSSSSSSSSL